MKRIGVWLLVLLLCLSLAAGCGKKRPSAEDIMRMVEENTKDLESMSANIALNMAMSYDMTGENEVHGAASVRMDADMEMVKEPLGIHMELAANVEADGEKQESVSEIYAISDGSQFTVYTGTDGEWYYENADLSEYQDIENSLSLATDLSDLSESDDVTYTLAEETETVNGHETYVLNGTISDETLKEFTNFSSDMESLLGSEIDLSGAEAVMKYYIYKDSFLPARLEIDLGSFMGDVLSSLGISIDEVKMVYTFLTFNEIDEIRVPDSVTGGAIDSSGSDGGSDIAGDSDSEEFTQQDDTLIDTEDTTVSFIESPLSSPSTIGSGDYSSTYTLLTEDAETAYYQVGVRVVDIKRGEEAQAIADQYNSDGLFFSELDENLEYGAITYEVYVPRDFTNETFSGVEIYLTDSNGEYFSTDYNFDDMYMVYTVDDSRLYVGPGETAVGTALFTMEKGRDDFLFEIGDSWYHEAYVKASE